MEARQIPEASPDLALVVVQPEDGVTWANDDKTHLLSELCDMVMIFRRL